MPDRRADLPISERGSAEDANGAPDVRESSTPSARAMALDAQRRRLQQERLRGLEFQKDGKRAVVLFRELSKASGSGNFDDQTRKQVRKKTEELDQQLRRMIEFLDGGRKTKPMRKINGQGGVPLSAALTEFARIAEPLIPQLEQVVSQQRDLVDLKLNQSVLASLHTVRERLASISVN